MIKQEIEKRKIEYLVHFTSASNLESILKNGLLSRNKLNALNIYYTLVDSNRFDGRLDYISASITNYNGRMLSKARMDGRIMGGVVVLYIDASIMYKMQPNVIFYPVNAATTNSHNMASNSYLSLRKMFDSEIRVELKNEIRYVNRQEFQPSNETTYDQAEVMIRDEIKPEYIKKVCFLDDKKIYDVIDGNLKYHYNDAIDDLPF